MSQDAEEAAAARLDDLMQKVAAKGNEPLGRLTRLVDDAVMAKVEAVAVKTPDLNMLCDRVRELEGALRRMRAFTHKTGQLRWMIDQVIHD